MAEFYDMQTRLNFGDNYDNYISAKELAKKGELRILISNFLEVYFNNPIEMSDILERGSVTPDLIAQQKIEESKQKTLKEIALRQAFIDNSLHEIDNNNGKLLEYIDSDKFKLFRNSLEVEEQVEEEENNSPYSKEDLALLSELDSIKTQLNAINFKLNGGIQDNESLQIEVNNIENAITQSIDEVFKSRMDMMEEKIVNSILENLSTKNLEIKQPIKEVKTIEKQPILEKEVERGTQTDIKPVREIPEQPKIKEEPIIKPVESIDDLTNLMGNLGITDDDEDEDDYYYATSQTPNQEPVIEEQTTPKVINRNVQTATLKELQETEKQMDKIIDELNMN